MKMRIDLDKFVVTNKVWDLRGDTEEIRQNVFEENRARDVSEQWLRRRSGAVCIYP